MLRPDLLPVPVRGNAETRLAMVGDRQLDAVVLGYAGLSRIGRLDAVTQVFRLGQMLPAPGQGALAVECRADRDDLASILAFVDDPVSRAAVTAERSLLAWLQAGCLSPVAAYASGTAVIHLRAVVVAADGARALRESASGAAAEAESVGHQVALRLLSQGAGRLMADSGTHAAREPSEPSCATNATYL
jgi:hydroxymethylbilane synthase